MASKSENHIPFDLDALEPWYRRPERIVLYCGLLPAALITPTALGFDQSMTNALQTIPYFQEGGRISLNRHQPNTNYGNQSSIILLGQLLASMELRSLSAAR